MVPFQKGREYLLFVKILKALSPRQRRFPKMYDSQLLADAIMRTLTGASQSFLTSHSLKSIEYLICVQCYLQKKIEFKERETKRNVIIKLFPISNIEGNRVFGIGIGLNLLQSNELLEEKHVYRALVSLIPGIEIIPDSFFSCFDKHTDFLFYYLEIKKLRGRNLTFKEIKLLKKKLPSELKQSMQTLSYSLLFSYNEEFIYKNAIQLAKELKSTGDLPQVTIYFQGHIKETLIFNVVLVRAKKKKDSAFYENILMPSSTRLIIQKILSLGQMQRGGD